jgi:hypothetical protein
MSTFRVVALSQARISLGLLRQALEDLEREPTLDAYQTSELGRLRHVVTDWETGLHPISWTVG